MAVYQVSYLVPRAVQFRVSEYTDGAIEQAIEQLPEQPNLVEVEDTAGTG
jgi:hypothetical protein